jgi:hypothetical protein
VLVLDDFVKETLKEARELEKEDDQARHGEVPCPTSSHLYSKFLTDGEIWRRYFDFYVPLQKVKVSRAATVN